MRGRRGGGGGGPRGGRGARSDAAAVQTRRALFDWHMRTFKKFATLHGRLSDEEATYLELAYFTAPPSAESCQADEREHGGVRGGDVWAGSDDEEAGEQVGGQTEWEQPPLISFSFAQTLSNAVCGWCSSRAQGSLLFVGTPREDDSAAAAAWGALGGRRLVVDSALLADDKKPAEEPAADANADAVGWYDYLRSSGPSSE